MVGRATMIATLSGKVTQIEQGSLVVELGGVGILVYVPDPLSDRANTGQSIFLHTYLVVREDALALYGFDTQEGRDYFKLLLGVSGIGPRLAVTILSTLKPEAIRRAVFSEQPEIFSRVPGVGIKTAQKIAFNLQDKISKEEGYEPLAAMSEADTEVMSALIALGYSVVEAQAALQSIPRDAPEDVESRLRIALVYFS
jgi:Holliday junction DNA helicase RuvA